MLWSADFLGFELMKQSTVDHVDRADYSGPTIGLCAVIEAVLHEAVIAPAFNSLPRARNFWDNATLGSVIGLLDDSMRNKRGAEYDAIRSGYRRYSINAENLASLLGSLNELNRRYRRPAAHRKIVTREQWAEAWRLV